MAYGGSGAVEWNVNLNGNVKFRAYKSMQGNYWQPFSCSGIVSATAGQYINIQNNGAGATSEGHGGTYSGFSVHLLG